MIHLHRRRKEHRGQAMVEFALIVPLFVLITLGIFDAGRAVYAHHTASNAARAAARVAIVDQDPVVVRAAAKNHTPGLGVTDADITLNSCSTWNCTYSVTVRVPYTAVTPLLSSIFNPTIQSTARMPVEFENP